MTQPETIAHYRITSKLGAGGMGAVYRAIDTKLDREVAIKILPDALAHDPDRLARFEREAKVLASLNHPHIAAIYGVEDRALVMELVPGETLRGPLPLATALNYARQIAEALEAAHEKGITHRDLKPANIMIAPDETVKVLDFGLATAPSREDTPDSAEYATFTMAATQAGIVMGTAGYMSPEQAAGKPVDRRSDIWSFGAVLWEMLTGARLFEGETLSHTLADVLREPIEFGKLPSSTPVPIVALIRRCLDRNVKTRLQAIGEARIVIDGYLKDPASAAPPAQGAVVPRRRAAWAPWGVAALSAALAVGLALVAYRHAQEPPPKVFRTSLMPPEKASFLGTSVPALSPDGNKLAFVALQDGKQTLWVRDLDSLTPRSITGTDNATNPFWSPDSQSIGFLADGRLKRVDVAGGTVLTICPIQGYTYGASWSPRGVIVFPTSPTGPLFRVAATGGAPSPVTALDAAAGEVSHRLPWFLPDGRHFLYAARKRAQAGKSAVYVGDLDSTDRVLVLQVGAHAAYVPSGGFLVYVPAGEIDAPALAQSFDVSSLRTTGDAVPIAQSVNSTTSVWASHQFSVSRDGTLVYASSGASSAAQLTWFDRTGKVLGTVGEPDAGIQTAAISPDGSTVATGRLQSGSPDIWLHDLTRGGATRFTFNLLNSRSTSPVWWGDGKSILFVQSDNSRPPGILRKALGSGNSAEVASTGGSADFWQTALINCSRDGRYLLLRFNSVGPTGSDIWIQRLDTPGEKLQPYLTSNANEESPSLSPAADWLAYSSDETQRFEVYIQSFPEPGRKYQVSVNGGRTPVWSRDGRELFFIAPDRQMMSVAVGRNGEKLDIGVPKALFNAKIVPGVRANFDVSKDGRFLIPVQDQSLGLPLTLVVNWQAGLKK